MFDVILVDFAIPCCFLYKYLYNFCMCIYTNTCILMCVCCRFGEGSSTPSACALLQVRTPAWKRFSSSSMTNRIRMRTLTLLGFSTDNTTPSHFFCPLTDLDPVDMDSLTSWACIFAYTVR